MELLTPTYRGGDWFVRSDEEGLVAGPFDTNAQAWRWIDKNTNEPHNRKEAAHDWSASEYLKS